MAGPAGLSDRRKRVLYGALAASIALHLFMLLVLPAWEARQEPAPQGTPLETRIAAPPEIALPKAQPAPAPPPQAAAAPPVQKPAAQPRPKPPPAPRAKEEVPAVPAREAAVAPPAPQVAETPPALPAPPVVSVPQALSGTEAAASKSAAPTPGEPDEARTVAEYRIQLIGAARRLSRNRPRPQYPPDAGSSTRVVIAVRVAADGASQVVLKGPSGYQTLDRDAAELYRAAVAAVPLPRALRGTAFTIEMPVDYKPDD